LPDRAIVDSLFIIPIAIRVFRVVATIGHGVPQTVLGLLELEVLIYLLHLSWFRKHGKQFNCVI